jgi:hypothetical protein
MDLQTVKFVNIFQKDKKGKNTVAEIPITRPQKIRAYIDMGDLQPKNASNNDHGWRLDPEVTAQIRDILEDPAKLEEISKVMGLPLDIVNAFHVFMYEVGRNRAIATKVAANSLDKSVASNEYEQEVAAARERKEQAEAGVPEPGTGKNYPPKDK